MNTNQTEKVTTVSIPLGTYTETVEIASIPNNEVALKRADTFKSMGEQLDMIFHDIEDGKLDKTGSFYKYILSIKTEYPKSE